MGKMGSDAAVQEFVANVLLLAQAKWEKAHSGPTIDQRFASPAFVEALGWLKILLLLLPFGCGF